MKYDYLKKYMRSNYGKSVDVWCNNVFRPVDKEEIEAAEKKLGYEFPSQLKEFWQEIGYGYLTTPHNPPPDYRSDGNEIIPPHAAANFALGIREWEGQRHYIAADIIEEDLQPGDLPFFDVSDSSKFLIMKLNSDNPNAVWTINGIKIQDSFERFIWRLYYESPCFYDDIIKKYYADLKSKKQD